MNMFSDVRKDYEERYSNLVPECDNLELITSFIGTAMQKSGIYNFIQTVT